VLLQHDTSAYSLFWVLNVIFADRLYIKVRLCFHIIKRQPLTKLKFSGYNCSVFLRLGYDLITSQGDVAGICLKKPGVSPRPS